MVIALKAIPTLHGDDAVRFRADIEKVDEACETRPERDLTMDSRYAMMRKIMSKAKLFSE